MLIASQTTGKLQLHRESFPQRTGARLFFWLRQSFASNAWLTIVGILMVITLVVACMGLLFDHRVIAGAPAWAKPAKFAISFSVYSFTFVWLLSFLQRWKKIAAVLAAVTSIALLVEMGLIVFQVIRGFRSHFNLATPFDTGVFQVMADGSVLILSAALVVAIFLLFERRTDRALIWSLRLSFLIFIAGIYAGVLMTQPTAAQLAVYHTTGHLPPVWGAHSVGVPDGGPGLPFLGWSIIGGDLRIAHFVGLHALQVMAFLGWFLSAKRFPGLRTRQRVALVWTFGLGYLGLDLSLLWQAVRGQSLIAPDALTWLTWGAVAALTLIVGGAIILHARWSTAQLKQM